jgi:hypothetical protein
MKKQELVVDLDGDLPILDGIVEEDGPIASGPAVDGDIVDEDLDPADRLPKHARRNSNGSVTLPLHFPQEIVSRKDNKIRKQMFSELVLNRLNGADQRAIAATSEDTMTVVALSRSTRINLAVMNALFDKLDMADLQAAGQVLNHFLASGPKTGR